MTSLSKGRRYLSEHPYIIAIAIVVLLVLWMLSGGQEDKSTGLEKMETPTPKVQVTTMRAEDINTTVTLYGRTEPNRIVRLKAEVKGTIEEVLVKRGSFVKKGQPIVRIHLNDIEAQLTRAKTLLKQREIEFEGNKSLSVKGFQGRVKLAEAEANLASVKADIERLTLDLERTVIRAPFDGMLNERSVEVGDYLGIGDDIAIVADLNPMVIRAYATENQVIKLEVNQAAQINLLDKTQATGELRYIASVADEDTNTFKLEIAIENANHALLAGMSSEVLIELEQVQAIKLSPALLALDESGNIGVKSVRDDTVEFTPIEMVKSESDGVWLAGLGSSADIITLGQGFVRPGDKVSPVFKKSTNEQGL